MTRSRCLTHRLYESRLRRDHDFFALRFSISTCGKRRPPSRKTRVSASGPKSMQRFHKEHKRAQGSQRPCKRWERSRPIYLSAVLSRFLSPFPFFEACSLTMHARQSRRARRISWPTHHDHSPRCTLPTLDHEINVERLSSR